MIAASGLTKRYPGGFEALRDVSFEVSAGEMVFITGHSGAGKSTLVKLVAAIERPTSGSLVVNGQNLAALRKSALPYLRRHFGLVFQDQKLLFDRNVLENVLLPLEIVGLPRREAVGRAQADLDKVWVLGREKARPIALSGGEQQRLAIARAVVNRPTVLLADEPTGNLDSQTSREIMSLFEQLNRDQGITIVLVTHEDDIAAYAKRLIRLKDGHVIYDKNNTTETTSNQSASVHAIHDHPQSNTD